LGLRFEFGKAQQGSVAAFGSLTLSHTRASTVSAVPWFVFPPAGLRLRTNHETQAATQHIHEKAAVVNPCHLQHTLADWF
jgi:hypothetical protein